MNNISHYPFTVDIADYCGFISGVYSLYPIILINIYLPFPY